MLYYKVPACMDNKRVFKKKKNYLYYTGMFYIKDSLWTPAECKKYGFDTSKMIPVNIKKTETYCFFGARFDIMGGC